ncbi:MAG: hypothetical protein OXC91_07055 [Rhodobacteraceae bacterium]|nr:hypothetical protein [Paracoccaceae bacterium]
MMTTLAEGKLTFIFPASCQVSKYDEWSFCRCQFQSVAGGCKAVDILCIDSNVSWLIEVKDYRHHPRTKPSCIADEFAIKVKDTLAGLAAAAKMANDPNEKQQAGQSLKTKKWRAVLHLEQSSIQSRLRPGSATTASLLQKLRTGKLRAIDAHPIICGRTHLHASIPWCVQ